MPIISFSKGDILRSNILESGWYSMQITKMDGWKKSSSGKGNIIEVTMMLIDHKQEDLNGKEFKFWIADQAMSMSLPLVIACKGIKKIDMPKEEFALDTDEILNAKVDASVTIDTEYDPNNPQNRVVDFAPYKSVVGAPNAF